MNAEDDMDDPLLPLAEKIAEGTTVDPDEEHERTYQHSHRDALNALLDIAAIGAAHQRAERSFDRMLPDALDVPRRWAHLTILEKIGEGEFGDVYRAHDSRLQIDVALKLSAVGAGQSPEASNVLDEARLLAKVRHPSVVRVYGADRKQGRVGLWMDLVQGQTLEELTKTQGFGASEATNIGIELCRALAAVHSVGVLHGDIKAHNVMRRDGGQIVLVDFGAGRPLAAEPRKGNDIIGTPVYMAPEVLDGQPRSAASDIYSLGVLLFHLVTNDYPVYATSQAAFIDAHKTGARKRLRDIRPDLPDGFIHLVERATAAVPQSRFSSAGALETELVHLLAPPEPVHDPSRNRNWRLWVGGASVTAILSMGAAFWGTGRAPGTTTATPTVVSRPGGTDVSLRADSYAIEAAFYRMNGAAGRELLGAGQSVKVSDEISLSVSTSAPTYLYVVNEDEQDEAYLLFPMPGQTLTNPLPANQEVRVPAGYNWQVSSAGGKEHFLVFASKERLSAFEDAFRLLPAPRVGGSGQSQRLPAATIENFRGLRGVGGLAPTEPDRSTPGARFRTLFTQPLSGREVVDGLWVRQLTLDNASGKR